MANFVANELLPRIINMSVTAGIVIVFVLLARLLLRKAPKVFSYALWSVVLFRLLCPISITTGFSLLELVNTPARSSSPYTTTVEFVRPDAVPDQNPPIQSPADPGHGTVTGTLPQDGAAPTKAGTPEFPPELPMAAALLWVSGILVMALYSVAAYVKIRRRLVGATPVRENIYLADHIPSPFVMGIIRPKIYLPSALSAVEQSYIIRHEQYHIRRLDPLVKALSFAALCIHWFNPLVWVAFLLSGKDMEMRCDEAVVKALGEDIRADYSASLLSLATGRRIIAGTPLAFGEGDAKGRIRNLVNWRAPKRWAVLLSAVVCIAVAVACAANPREAGSARYDSMEDFARQTMAAVQTVTYHTTDGGEATAAVTDTKLAWLEKQGEVAGLAPEGTLEAWTFSYLVQVDADTEKIILAGGMYEEDDWYDLEGQGGHNVVALRYEDGSYDILYNQPVNDNLDFYGYHNSYEEAVYDWYVKDRGLDLPLYTEDWIDRIDVPDLGNFPVHRFDGNGWYLYVPVQGWDWVDAPGYRWQSGYGTGSALTVYPQDQDARTRADESVSLGWIEVEGAVPHVRHWDGHTENYFYDAPDGGCYQVRIEWQEQNLAGNPYTEMEPAVLTAMAERFTVDEGIAGPAHLDEIPLTKALNAIQEDDPLTLGLVTGEGVDAGIYDDSWSTSNAVHFFHNLSDYGWRVVEGDGLPATAGRDAVTLSHTDAWSLTAFAGIDAVRFTDSEGEWWVIQEVEDYTPYQALRSWFDEAEYAALNGDYNHQNIVIPDEGQGYLAAAAAYVEAFEGIHLQATPGSSFCYSFVSTSVEAAEETTAAFRERGEIDENTYAFYLTTVFVPQNETAAHYSMAGNTGEYTGSDPSVPEGAMEYYRCGFISLEGDGWRGRLVGTGW